MKGTKEIVSIDGGSQKLRGSTDSPCRVRRERFFEEQFPAKSGRAEGSGERFGGPAHEARG